MMLSGGDKEGAENSEVKPAGLNSDKKSGSKARPAKKITTRKWLDQYSKQLEKLEDITAEKKESLDNEGLADLVGDILQERK